MSNVRKLADYNPRSNKCAINIDGKKHWFDRNAAFDANAKMPGHYGVKVKGQNFFFPINENLQSGVTNPYWSVKDNKISRTIPPLVFPRIRIDPQFWREVMYEMENKPWNWRVKAQQMNQDVILDAHVKACWQKRKRLTLLKTPAFFDKNKQPIENSPNLEFIHSDWWIQLCDYILDAQGYGYQLVELGNLVDFSFPEIGVVPRQNISPDREVVTAVVYNVNGILFNINPSDKVKVGKKDLPASAKSPEGQYYYDWQIWIKTPNEFGSHTSTCGYGIFYWIGLYSILIRNNLQNNADYNEKFLQPIRDLSTNKTDEKERQRVFNQLVDAGASLTFLHDPEDELKLLQNTTSGQVYKTYADFETRMKKAISALILGHEDAMHSVGSKLGGGSSQGGSGKSGHDDPIQESLTETGSEQNRWLCAHINNNVIPKLRKLGFNIPYDIKYGYINDDEQAEAQEKQNKNNIDFSTTLVNLSKAGYEVAPEYIEEITGIPVKKTAPPPIVKPQLQPKENDVPDEEELEAVKNFYNDLQKTYAKHSHGTS